MTIRMETKDFSGENLVTARKPGNPQVVQRRYWTTHMFEKQKGQWHVLLIK